MAVIGKRALGDRTSNEVQRSLALHILERALIAVTSRGGGSEGWMKSEDEG